MGTLQINTLGTSFEIQAKEDDAYLKNLLSYFNQVSNQIEATTELKDPLKIAILSGIMICDELYKEKKKNAENIDKKEDLFEAERLTLQMIEKIARVL
ncbi:MAG: cell division protein ZapA [Spirochaetaceae bacterium]|nr:cell division protein ZapA [Spirochaetaceae bacterium]MBQ4554639.1 cell division protein ZapA [Spirochaetaceae bacterium]MBQ8353661.1 cell division protein ZapA [Spirochaetaceae bacterium]